MELLIFFGVVFLIMLMDNLQIKKDINANSKIHFTKNDAENYCGQYFRDDV